MDPIPSAPKNIRLMRPDQIPIPWSPVYNSYHDQFITFAITNDSILEYFQKGWQLPDNFGVGIDERCVEFPWYFSLASPGVKTILDAGSSLNFDFAVNHQYFNDKTLTILTLAPEENCFWRLAISYQFADLRDLPYKDHYFDEIVSISTIEHVGLDNSLFTGVTQNDQFNENDFVLALNELNRVLKPEGRLMVTVPFGKYENWGEFQQFDADLLDKAAESFGARRRLESYYYYTSNGWKLTNNRMECRDMKYSRHALRCQWGTKQINNSPETDLAAAARAVACCVWKK